MVVMSRLSQFRTKEGEIATMATTKTKAIKLKCLDCVGFSYLNVRDCESKTCHLYPYRLGKNPNTGKSRSRALILYCISCMNEQPKAIRNCVSKYCPLFVHRIGAGSQKKIEKVKRVERVKRVGRVKRGVR